MLIWSVPCVFFTGIVVLLDYILRRKKWNENTQTEKNGLFLTFLFSFPYIFCSVYGIFMGIVAPDLETDFMKKLYDMLLIAGFATALVCLAMTILSLILRKMGKARAANWALVVGVLYCTVVLAASLIIV